MENVEPSGLIEMAMRGLGAACDCMCSSNQTAGANGAGLNADACGCYCAGGSANNNANKGGAKNSLSGVFEALQQIEATLKGLKPKT